MHIFNITILKLLQNSEIPCFFLFFFDGLDSQIQVGMQEFAKKDSSRVLQGHFFKGTTSQVDEEKKLNGRMVSSSSVPACFTVMLQLSVYSCRVTARLCAAEANMSLKIVFVTLGHQAGASNNMLSYLIVVRMV